MIDHPRRHFFDDEGRFAGKVSYDILHEGIELKPNSSITGSCTPIYTYWKPAMERIRNYHPGIKLIILLRNPINRAFSQWNMNWDRQRETLGFLEAIAAEVNERETSPFSQSRRRSYVDRGYYFEQVERVFRFFPRDQVRVIKFEEFRKTTAETVNEVFRFLGVKPLAKIKNREQNRIPYERKIAPEERRYLYSLLRGGCEPARETSGLGLLRLEGRMMRARALARSTSSVDCCAAKKRGNGNPAACLLNNLT